MWQRQIQPVAFSGTSESSAAGCGSCTTHTSQPSDELARVHLVVLRPGRPLLLGEVLRVALQRVVHQLRRVEELLAAVDHLPLDLEPDVAHQRHERVEDLRDAAAERGGRQVHDAPALQRLGELADLLDERAADDVRVVGEALVGEGDGLEHGRRDDTGKAGAAQPASGEPESGRSPSLTVTSRRSPSRHASTVTVAPGSSSATARERSSGSSTGRPSMLRDHVAAVAVAARPGSVVARRRRRAGPPSSAGPSGDDVLDPGAVADRQVEALAQLRVDRHGLDAEVRVGDLARRRAAGRASAARRRPGPRSRRPRRRRSWS